MDEQSMKVAVRVFVCLASIGGWFSGGCVSAEPSPASEWVSVSNGFTQRIIDVELRHNPEMGSQEGLAAFDPLISRWTLADQMAKRAELAAVAVRLGDAQSQVSDSHVRQDLAILRQALDLRFRVEDFESKRVVPYWNASAIVFQGLRVLLDDQVAPERRSAALIRLRRYAGKEPGFTPLTEVFKQRMREQLAKPGVIYPSRVELATELGRNGSYLEGMPELFRKYHLKGWEQTFDVLKHELVAYDQWVRAVVLPHARDDFRMPADQYALALEQVGIDIPPARVAEMAHAAFADIQAEMAVLSAQIARQRDYPSADYRSVIGELKTRQLTGDAILPFYRQRLEEIEKIIVAEKIVSLPNRPAIIRLATAAETAAQPAPHMDSPAFLNNTGERGEFVLPLNIPSASGGEADTYDDFTFDAVAWTLTAHEARPGHELQFASMVEHGVSLARALYAFNSTNVEGWGLYSEYLLQPYEPAEGQLCTLQLRLLRAARAFLDPELQAGKITPEEAYTVLEHDVMLSHAFAKEEVERFTYRAPGQANSYFYGYTRILALRREVEALLGTRFDARKFHDFLLAQGLLPPDLMRQAVLDEFVPTALATEARAGMH